MTVGPWSVKGIDPKAREVAKDLARRSGMTLGEWLNQMIIEGDADGATQGSTPASALVDGETLATPFASLVDARPSSGRTPDYERIARAVEQLSARVEAAEHRSTLAISGIDQSVNGIVARFGEIEKETAAAAARVAGALEEARQSEAETREQVQKLAALEGARGEILPRLEGALRDLQGDISHTARRVDRAEAKMEGAAAPAGFEEALSKIAARLDGVESSSSDAVRSLQSAFADLETRLKTASGPGGEALERRLEQLSGALTEKIELSRRELADRLREVAGGGVDGVEARLQALGDQVKASERRSAEAIETMGREVLKVASSLGERVRQSEARTALTAQTAGEQMNRIAGAIDQRLGVQEAAHAEALERLGGEIARIAEKLTDRILSVDKRSAQAIDDVGDQLGRVTERLNQRFERQETELGERIRLAEERTAKLLDDAQGQLETRFSELKRRTSLEAAADSARKAAEADLERAGAEDTVIASASFPPPRIDVPVSISPLSHVSEPEMPFGPSGGQLEEAHAPSFMTAAAEPEAAYEPPAFMRTGAPPPAPPPFVAHEEAPFAPEEPEAFVSPSSPAQPSGPAAEPLSTRDMIEQARAAARRAAEPAQPRRGERGAVDAPPLLAESSGFAFPFARKKKKEGVALRTALLASGTAAALAVTAVGAVSLVNSEIATANNERSGPAPTAAQPEESASRRSADAPPPRSAPASADQMAIALSTPPPVEPSPSRALAPGAATTALTAAGAPAPEVADNTAARPLYSAAVRRIEGGDLSGVEDLKRAANLGFAPAEFYLAQLLEKGAGGLPRDLNAARRWTERAAMGGETAAMHNLAMYFYEGEGGPQDTAQALKWFSRAADEGVRDSQYNLALLYAQGLGTPQNLAEAYKWYLVAAAQGDAGARDAAKALRPQLTPETQSAAERAAAAFHARVRGAVRTAMATNVP
jgi:localization factor PodJL